MKTPNMTTEEFNRLPQEQKDWLGYLNYCELHEGLRLMAEKIVSIEARLNHKSGNQVAEVEG